MAGLVLDIYVEFILRWIVLWWRKAGSRGWQEVTGTIVSCQLERPGFGCARVVLRYKYKWDFERYQGVIKKPYIYDNYADAYMRHHPPDSELRIRVDPSRPARSVPVKV